MCQDGKKGAVGHNLSSILMIQDAREKTEPLQPTCTHKSAFEPSVGAASHPKWMRVVSSRGFPSALEKSQPQGGPETAMGGERHGSGRQAAT